MIEVLEFLYQNLLVKQIDIESHMDLLARELPRAGFNLEEISSALKWLGKTVANKQFSDSSLNLSQSQRIYTQQELLKLDKEARGLLYHLELTGLLTPVVREFMIERAMELQINIVSKEEMQWVILFVMMNSNMRNDVIASIQSHIEIVKEKTVEIN